MDNNNYFGMEYYPVFLKIRISDNTWFWKFSSLMILISLEVKIHTVCTSFARSNKKWARAWQRFYVAKKPWKVPKLLHWEANDWFILAEDSFTWGNCITRFSCGHAYFLWIFPGGPFTPKDTLIQKARVHHITYFSNCFFTKNLVLTIDLILTDVSINVQTFTIESHLALVSCFLQDLGMLICSTELHRCVLEPMSFRKLYVLF